MTALSPQQIRTVSHHRRHPPSVMASGLPRRFARVKVVVAGGSGALGRRLCADLACAGYEVVVLTRRQRHGPHRQVEWDGRTVGPWREELEGSAVVNLAGELVDRRPTAANVSLLTTSRVDPTLALVEASRSLDVPVPVWVQASTLAIYGDAGDSVLDESAKAADGPPRWQASPGPGRPRSMAPTPIASSCCARGSSSTMTPRHSTGSGGWPGGASEVASARARSGSAGSTSTTGWPSSVPPSRGDQRSKESSHATGPEPTRNADLMAALRRSVGRPVAPPTPALLVRLGAVLLRTDPALALTGRRAVPARLLARGFQFAHPDLDEALADLQTRRSKRV